MDEVADNVAATKHTLGPLKFRMPRFLHQGDKVRHHDSDDDDDRPAARSKTIERVRSALGRDKINDMPYLSWTPTLGRNSQFHNLTLEQREELVGGIEYRSLRTLARVTLCATFGGSTFRPRVLAAVY